MIEEIEQEKSNPWIESLGLIIEFPSVIFAK